MYTITISSEDGAWEKTPDVEAYEALEWFDDERGQFFPPYMDGYLEMDRS